MRGRSIMEQIRSRILRIGIFTFVIAILLSFLVLFPMLQERAIINAENANEEIIWQLNTELSFMEKYTDMLALSVAQNEVIQNYFKDPTTQNRNRASLALNNLVGNNGIIRNVSIESNDLLVLDSLNRITDEDSALLESNWYEKQRSKTFNSGWSPVYVTTVKNVKYYVFAYTKNFYMNNEWYTFVTFASLNDALYDIREIGKNSTDYFILCDATGDTFYAYGDEKLQEEAEELKGEEKATSRVSLNNGIGFVNHSIENRWGIVSIVSHTTIMSSLAPYILELLFILTAFLILILVSTSQTVKRAVQPIIGLSQTMESAVQGNLDCKVTVDRDDEIGQLENSFNKMLEDLREDRKLILEKEKKEQHARFGLLVSQIDPHFICNTINSINYLARKKRCEDIIVVNSSLITIIRDRLRVNDIQITDTIAHEKSILETYIRIQKYMYDGDLEMIWNVEDEVMEEQIPKNMLQPLVENAIFHGLIDEEIGEINGEIVITAERIKDGIRVEVRDNGRGISPQRLREIVGRAYIEEERGRQIGLSNVQSRLYYLYGERECLHIESAEGKGTAITIIFPK